MPPKSPARNKAESFYEVICSPGLERFVQRELRRSLGKDHQLSGRRAPGEVLFSMKNPPARAFTLETAEDLFRVLPFDVARPRGILEPLKLREISGCISGLSRAQKSNPFRSFRLSAAGGDSKDLTRIRETIATATGLKENEEDGDLLLRLRKSRILDNGWDLLIRVAHRPLHVRPWRRSDYRGALSAPTARVMVELLDLKEGDRFLDPMCGSGTILIEQLRYRKVKSCTGVEILPRVLEQAKKNLANVKQSAPTTLVAGDGTKTGIEAGTIDGIAVNPPWGEAVREKEGLPELYRALIQESARVLKPGGKLCVIVQAVSVFEEQLKASQAPFTRVEKHSVLQRKGFHPTIILLKKN